MMTVCRISESAFTVLPGIEQLRERKRATDNELLARNLDVFFPACLFTASIQAPGFYFYLYPVVKPCIAGEDIHFRAPFASSLVEGGHRVT